MDIILLKDLDKVGDKYEFVSVKLGYVCNYFIFQGLAFVVNDVNCVKFNEIKCKEEEELVVCKVEFVEMVDNLKGKVLKIGVKVGISGKIFGSVINVQLVVVLKD